ncbi:MAG: hypothetical protein AAGC68_01665, partial [Verrucomicrobiota bacterium]
MSPPSSETHRSILKHDKSAVPDHRERLERVRTAVTCSSAEACRRLAEEVVALIRERQDSGKAVVLGLATGSTPVPFYRELIRWHEDEGVSFSNVI